MTNFTQVSKTLDSALGTALFKYRICFWKNSDGPKRRNKDKKLHEKGRKVQILEEGIKKRGVRPHLESQSPLTPPPTTLNALSVPRVSLPSRANQNLV